MTTAINSTDTHPHRDFNIITQIGLKAYSLGLTYQAEIDARLPGTLTALANDLTALGVVVSDAIQLRKEVIVATAEQNALLKEAYAHLSAIRKTVRKARAPKEIQRAYGVGLGTNPRKVSAVKAALQQIAGRAAQNPQEAAALGIIAADVATLNTFITQLTDTDTTQEKKRATAPLTTQERNLTANRILQTAGVIAGTGMRAFVGTSPAFENFEALMASTQKPRKRAATAKVKKAPAALASRGTERGTEPGMDDG